MIRRAWPWLALLAGALLPLAGVLTDPLGTLPGLPESDVYKHAWSFWHAPATLGTWPRTHALGAPDGGVLLDVMLLPGLLLAPVTALVGPVGAANLWVVLSLLAVGASVRALTGALGAGPGPSTAAGLLAQGAPALLGYPLVSGVHERLAVWVFPLLLLALVRAADTGRARWSVVAALAVGIAAAGCQVYGPFAAVLGLLALPLLLAPSGGGPREVARRALRILPPVLAAGVALAAVYAVVRWAALHPDSLSPQAGRVDLTLGAGPRATDTATLAALFDPRVARAETPRRLGDVLYRTVYLGWVPLLAAAGGVAAAFRGRAAGLRPWRTAAVAALGLAFALLSLGPSFTAFGVTFRDPLVDVLGRLVPAWGAIPPVWQHAVVPPLLLAAAAGPLVALPRRPGARIAAGVALLALTVGERAWAMPFPLIAPVAPARTSDAWDALPGPGPVADVPRWRRGEFLSPGEIFLAQTRHRQPIPASINLRPEGWDHLLQSADEPGADCGALADRIRAAGVRHLAVHRGWFGDPGRASACVAAASARAGAPFADDGDLVLWDLGAPPSGLGSSDPRR